MSFHDELLDKTEQIEQILKTFLPEESGYQKTVIEAINYSMLAGGKRLRPMLMQETYHMFGGRDQIIEPLMAALEMIHNYSLVHDDLPAMDNDEYRRGRKTTHTVYGEGMAVLAGDGLLNLAFETGMKAFSMAENEQMLRRAARAMQILGEKAGVWGMIGGQTADIEAEDGRHGMTRELLLFIHKHKTAALIQAAMMIGAVLAGADEEKIRLIEKAAYNIGIAFQIQDDILDVTSTLEVLGKPIGSDEKNNKITYVTLVGMEQSIQEVADLSAEAVNILNSFPMQNSFLTELVEHLITREK